MGGQQDRSQFAWRPRLVPATLAAALAVTLVAVGPADETSPDRPAASSLPPAGPPLPPAALDQLQRLRQEIGPAVPADGGAFAPLPGADAAPPQPDAQFGETLRRITDPRGPDATPTGEHAERPVAKRVQLLRAAARQLDEVAHQLESGDHYDEADRIAREADLLRLRARALRRSPAAGVPAPIPSPAGGAATTAPAATLPATTAPPAPKASRAAARPATGPSGPDR